MSADQLQWTSGPGTATRCTEATLNAFGIWGEVPHTGLGVLETLCKNGYGYAGEEDGRLTKFGRVSHGTVRAFMKAHPTGDYYISTEGHAMALRDGLLTDTAERGIDGRIVRTAYRIRKVNP